MGEEKEESCAAEEWTAATLDGGDSLLWGLLEATTSAKDQILGFTVVLDEELSAASDDGLDKVDGLESGDGPVCVDEPGDLATTRSESLVSTDRDEG